MEDNDFYGREKIAKILFKIAPPVMLAQLIQALYNIVDSLFVGRYSESGLTALSIIYPIQLLMIALGVGTGVGMLWSSIFVTLQPNFCYGIIRHHNVPRKAFCNYCKNADVHDYNVHMQILPLQYTVLFLSDNNVDRLTHFLMY